MKNKRTYYYLFAGTLMLLLQAASCKKDTDQPVNENPNPAEEKHTLTINLGHTYGDTPFALSHNYITPANDTIRVTDLLYYFTNIRLEKEDGSTVAPETYYLVDFSNPASTSISLELPKANYKKLSFMVGVDPAHNHNLAQTGALDPAHNMYWSWTTEYIFYRIKGKVGAAATTFSFDLAGDANLMQYQLATPVTLDQNRTVNVTMDIKELFEHPNTYDLKTDDKDIHTATGASVTKLVQNAQDMFRVSGVQ